MLKPPDTAEEEWRLMRVAIIGCGNIAQVHAKALAQIDSVQIVSFVDCKKEKAEKMSSSYTNNSASAYEDYAEMLKKETPDVVHICTPHYLHVPMAIEALKCGASVFMEKPPGISLKEFESLQAVADSSNASLGFCFQNRYNATTLELDRIVNGREMGEVIGVRGFVTWRRDAGYYSDDWHGSLEKEGGGTLINQSIHTLDLMLRYLGKPVKIAASMQNHHLRDVIEVEDTIEAWMEFEGGKRASFYATNAYAGDAPVILEISFEKGRATMIDKAIQIKKDGEDMKTFICEEKNDSGGKAYWGKGHLSCIKDFYECIEKGLPFQNDIHGVKNTFETTMNIYEDARRREREEK